MRNGNNVLITGDKGDLYFIDPKLASFDIYFIWGDVWVVGVSMILKQIFIEYPTGKKILFKATQDVLFQNVTSYGLKEAVINEKLDRLLEFEYCDYLFTSASPTEVCKLFRAFQYTMAINNIDLVEPDNCFRIV